MSGLSISKAWEETKGVLGHDGRLFASVALALLVLPTAVLGAFYPGGVGAVLFAVAESNSAPLSLLLIVVFLVILTGQLTITRLAIGPSVTVGSAIAHALRRLPSYIAVVLIVGLAILIAMLMAAAVIGAVAPYPASKEQLSTSPAVVIAVIVMLGVYLFLLTRIASLCAAITTTESANPIRIIRRSWALSSGHFLRLFGFLVVFLIGTGIAAFAITSVAVALLQLFVGHIDAMSASALILSLVTALVNGAILSVFAVMLARIYIQLAGIHEVKGSVHKSGI